jgi:4'-phosphopantetheinyl transferase
MLGKALRLAGNEVHVWVLDLDRPAFDMQIMQILSEDEHKRADRFVTPANKHRYRTARSYLRQILGLYLDKEPSSLIFEVNAAGKPSVASGSLDQIKFNLAHSDQHGLVAITCGADVGIDIEVERRLDDLPGVAQQVMSSSELRSFQSIPCHLASKAFFGLWTRKEALLKATGEGFSIDPRSFDVGLENSQVVVEVNGRIWSVAPLDALLPRTAAIAVSGYMPTVRMRNWIPQSPVI